MPCYCDIPAETDQVEIEKRCKIRMYFEAQSFLTSQQIEECQRIDLRKFPLDGINDDLCKLCKVLTEEQMKHISAYYYNIKWPYRTLYDWHVQHCKDDEKFNNQ